MSSTRTRTKCAFRSIRCGRRRRSTPSASTTTRRWPTGATAPAISTARSQRSIYDRAYLAAQSRGGEGYDWYYADDAARAAQTRSADHRRARQALDVPRKGSLELVVAIRITSASAAPSLATPTAWVPQGKPIWLTEVGCPAVDKGANQPSVFPDPKSSEGGVPYFSNGRRDDLIQRRYLEAVLGAFDPALGATTRSIRSRRSMAAA